MAVLRFLFWAPIVAVMYIIEFFRPSPSETYIIHEWADIPKNEKNTNEEKWTEPEDYLLGLS